MISIAADSQIPGIEESLLEYFAHDEFSLFYFQADRLIPEDLQGIDALLVRSTVQVNKKLCSLSELKYVGSATAGINHLDIRFLEDSNIAWSHAPGCNACSVSHYIMAAIGELIQQGIFNPRQTVGIVGYGNIGKKIYALLSALNIESYACDPFLPEPHLVSLDHVLDCDLITIHVPYSSAGAHPTKNLINFSHQSTLENKILLNTSRGGIISEELLLDIDNLIYVADVWMNEPTPNVKLIQKAFLSTPHIAGYSIEGKMNGSSVIAEQCSIFFGQLKEKKAATKSLIAWPHDQKQIVIDMHGHGFPISLFSGELDINKISQKFKAINASNLASSFKSMRSNHPTRHDFNCYSYEGMEELDEELRMDLFETIQKL